MMTTTRNPVAALALAGIALTAGLATTGNAAGPGAGNAAGPGAGNAAGNLSARELAIWNDPAFQDRFARSYIAETEIEPRVDREERDTMRKVMKFIAANETDEAADLLQHERGDRASAVFDFTLANLFFQAEELDHAAAAYEVAVGKHPKFRRAWGNLGMVYFRQAAYAKALPALTRVIELGGADALTYGLIGYSYASLGNSYAAESAYRMAVLLDPDTLDWKKGLVTSLFRQERFADAAALCDQLIRDTPDRAEFWLLQANAYIGLEKPMKAAQNYELVDRLGGSTADSLNMLGDIYLNEGLFDLAVRNYVRAMAKDDNGILERPIRAARALTRRGALDETRDLLERMDDLRGATMSAAERKELLKLRALVAVADGAGDEEVRVLEEVVALDPLDGEALILLAEHSRRTGDTSKAIFYFERAEGLEAHEAEAKLKHAQLLVGEGRYADAVPLLKRVQALDPRDSVQDYLEQVERIAKSR